MIGQYVKSSLILCALLTLTSCGITTKAKEAAKEWWDENGKVVVSDAADAAKQYWNEKKGELLDSAKEAAKGLSDSALAEAKAYIDNKLTEQRNASVKRLIDNGAKFSDIDVNGDGQITDEELDTYVKSNPLALWYGGAALAGWWALWQLRKRMGTGVQQAAAPAPAIAAAPPKPTTGVDATNTKS